MRSSCAALLRASGRGCGAVTSTGTRAPWSRSSGGSRRPHGSSRAAEGQRAARGREEDGRRARGHWARGVDAKRRQRRCGALQTIAEEVVHGLRAPSDGGQPASLQARKRWRPSPSPRWPPFSSCRRPSGSSYTMGEARGGKGMLSAFQCCDDDLITPTDGRTARCEARGPGESPSDGLSNYQGLLLL